MLGHFPEAEAWCRRAASLDRNRANALKNLGLALAGQHRWIEAAESFLEATEANISDPRALRHLEDLVRWRPSLPDEIEGFSPRLAEVRAAVAHARGREDASPPDGEGA